MLENNIILLGYSGHGSVLIDVAIENNLKIIGYSDPIEKKNNFFNLKYLGSENDENFIGWDLQSKFIIGIGNNNKREKVFNYLKSKGKVVSTLKSISSNISKKSIIKEGVFISKNVIINANSIIRDNVILNTGCIIEHDCELSKSVHIGPGAILNGGVKVGNRTFIGAGAIVLPGIYIGKNAIIGAGTVVTKNVLDGQKIVGNPSRIIT